jgi:hypothetical protein
MCYLCFSYFDVSRRSAVARNCYCPSDRIGYWLRNIFWSYGYVIALMMIMISTFACNNGLIMAGASVLYNGSRRSFQESGSAE